MTDAPRRISNPNHHQLRLEWTDGATQTLDFVDLRFECPCAHCVDEKTGKRLIRRGQIKPDVRPAKITPVGNYAVRIDWSDAHSSGIYTYERLREVGERYSHPNRIT